MKYSIAQVAQKIGVPAKWVYNAAYNNAHGMSYRPWSQVGQVNTRMDIYCVPWADVHFPVRRRRNRRWRKDWAVGEG